MSYIRKGLSGVSSQPRGRRIYNHALTTLSGVSSQPRGRRTANRALGSVVEYPVGQVAIDIVSKPLPPPPPPKPPPQQRQQFSRRLPLATRLGLGGTLGDTTPATVIDPDTRAFHQRSLELQSQMVAQQQGDKTQKWIQIAATIMIPVSAAIWRAIGVGRKRSPT